MQEGIDSIVVRLPLRPAGRASVARVFKPWMSSPTNSPPGGRTKIELFVLRGGIEQPVEGTWHGHKARVVTGWKPTVSGTIVFRPIA